jgi:hypothetical protein
MFAKQILYAQQNFEGKDATDSSTIQGQNPLHTIIPLARWRIDLIEGM